MSLWLICAKKVLKAKDNELFHHFEILLSNLRTAADSRTKNVSFWILIFPECYQLDIFTSKLIHSNLLKDFNTCIIIYISIRSSNPHRAHRLLQETLNSIFSWVLLLKFLFRYFRIKKTYLFHSTPNSSKFQNPKLTCAPHIKILKVNVPEP